jgi:hypothetical protein
VYSSTSWLRARYRRWLFTEEEVQRRLPLGLGREHSIVVD